MIEKIGRNDQCTCGSGKKYKVCCFGKNTNLIGQHTDKASIARQFQDATAHHQKGRLLEAEALYQQMLQIDPDNADVLHLLGVIASQRGNHETAAALIKKAISAKPSEPVYYNNLGIVLKAQGKLNDAVSCYRRMISTKPDHAEAHYNLGNALTEQGKMDEAVACYQKALSIKPDYADVYNNIGIVCKTQGKLEKAIANYRKALSLKPNFADAYNNLGVAFKDQGRPEDAISSYRKALALKPDFAQAYSNLLFLYSYRAMLAPDTYLTQACGWEKACLPPQERQKSAAKTFQRPPLTDRRLKVGYVSGDYRQHAVGYYLKRIFACHDRTRIELFSYSTNGVRDTVTEEYMAMADHYVSLTGLGHRAAASCIETDGIDVLIDCSGHTAYNRLDVFALRSAPVQLHYLGFFASTGLSQMDYWIGDAILTPPETDDHFTERIWRLPRVWVAYEGKSDAPLPDWRPDPRGTVWLGSFNNLNKLTPKTLALWAKVLHALPEGRLVLKTKELADAQNRHRIWDAMAGHGIALDRIELHDSSVTPTWSSHMDYYNRIDITLDPVGGVGGGTTTCDALWMGAPLITMIGDRMVSRMTASMLHAIGRPEWVSHSVEDYVDKVVSLARNVDLRRHIRFGQRPQMAQSPLCDTRSLTEALENAYFDMFKRRCEKQG